eukprot:Hpha_TRINITY_DN2337_c0_g1::TRINITY_DN2337_c0_g1_i2::g.441::m.441
MEDGIVRRVCYRRRWVELKRREKAGEFFSLAAMRERAPQLYIMYFPEDGRREDRRGRQQPVSGQRGRRVRRARAFGAMEEDDGEVEVSSDGDDASCQSPAGDEVESESDEDARMSSMAGLDAEDSAARLHELRDIMRRRFIDGEEPDVDYAIIDADVLLDEDPELRIEEDEVFFGVRDAIAPAVYSEGVRRMHLAAGQRGSESYTAENNW